MIWAGIERMYCTMVFALTESQQMDSPKRRRTENGWLSTTVLFWKKVAVNLFRKTNGTNGTR